LHLYMSESKLLLYKKFYDFSLWMTNHTGKFPKSHRFSYSVKMENLLLDTLFMINRSNHARLKNPFFPQLERNFDEISILLRMSHDLKFINFSSYEYAVKSIDEIRKIFGGWSKKFQREVSN
jgi:hypothetical protein